MIWLGFKMFLELDRHLIGATEYEEKTHKYKTKLIECIKQNV